MKGIRSAGLAGGLLAVWLGPLAGLSHAACGAQPALTRNVLGTATGTAVAGATLEFDATGSGYAAGEGENLVTLSQLFPKGQGARAITGQVTRRGSGQVAVEWRRIIDNREKVVAIGVNASGRLFFALRSNGAAALGVTEGPAAALPVWLRLNRVGGTIAGYYSANGADWTLLSSAPDILGDSQDQAYASFTASGSATLGDACLDPAARVPRYPVKACTTPNPAVAKATFSILSDDMAEVLVNGYYVGETSEHQFLSPMVLDVNPCFLAGGLRLIAVKNYDNQDNMMGVSYKLEIRYADGTTRIHTSNASENVQYVFEGNSGGRGDREPFRPVAKDAAGRSWYEPDFVPDARWSPAVNFPAGCEASLGHIDPAIPWISYPKVPCPAANAGNEIAFRQFYDIPQVAAGLRFTDEAGVPLPAGAFWSPAKGKLHLSFTDDFVGADFAKTFSISIRNRNGAALPDSESIVIKTHAKPNAATGRWEAVVDLAESRAPARLNGKAEVYLLGEITAKVAGHDAAGVPDGTVFTATLKAAYPDGPAAVSILDADAQAAAVDRFTPRISITLKDQDVSSLPNDTLWAKVACGATGDLIPKFALVERTPGTYVSAPLGKGEGPANPADLILSCGSTDTLRVTYADEIYGTPAVAAVAWVPIPIPPNPATAWIKDEDGDGAGDHVYFGFQRPLTALPASIGPVHWNTEAAASANASAPIIAFVPGTDQKRVSADYRQTPFGKGLTGIPAGALPYATLPAGEGFEGQKPSLADSMGPVLLNAFLSAGGYPKDPALIVPDTLRVTLSEALAPADHAGLLRSGDARDGACGDYPGSAPVPVTGGPVVSADGLAVTVLIDASQPRTPIPGDCVYLDTGPGIADRHGNRPPEHGVRLAGSGAGPYVLMNAYPPVAGRGPDSVATVQVIANRKYVASVSIFDNLGHAVTGFTQTFGYRGELGNRERRAGNRGWTGYLVWDLRDRRGRLAGQGVYIWNIALRFDDGTTYVKRIRTGLLR